MSLGTSLFLSTIVVLAYHLAYNKPGTPRKVVIWVMGIVVVLGALFCFWVAS
jgi:hypothetical protein